MNSSRVETLDGISWYVESIQNAAAESVANTDKQHIILIPSGEGDCHNLSNVAKNLASLTSRPTKITTFDMPGFSRTTAPKEAYDIILPDLIARQVDILLDKLDISQAVFFGCSSGGGTVLALAALFPERVKCGIVHEVPLAFPPQFKPMLEGTDDELSQRGRYLFDSWIEDANDGKAKYAALGDEYFHRLERNWVTWLRHLVSRFEAPTRDLVDRERENFKKVSVFWTIGALSDLDMWAGAFEVAGWFSQKVNTEVLRCMHFPAVTLPEETAEWILRCVEQVDAVTPA